MTALPTIIVGAGLMGHWHGHAVVHSGGRIAAVVDTDAARATALARRHPGVAVFDDLHLALSASGRGVVHLCSPLQSHGPLALDALRAGFHVLVEKPLAATLAEADALISTAAAVERLLCPVHQFLFQPGALRAAVLLPSLGTLLHVEAEVCSTGAERGTASADDVALEILPHALSFAARFCSRPITGVPWSVRRSAAGELLVGASIGETSVSARVSMRGRPPVNTLRLVAERGTIHLDLFHGFAVVERTGTSRAMKIARPPLFAVRVATAAAANLAWRALRRESAYPGLRELVRRFHTAATTGGPAPISTAETRAVAVVWEEIRSQLSAGAA